MVEDEKKLLEAVAADTPEGMALEAAMGGAGGGKKPSMPSIGGGGINWGKIIMILVIIGIIAVVGFLIYFWFINVGGGQATSGLGYRISETFSGIFNNYLFRSFSNMLANPFGIGPTGGQYEETEQKTKAPPNQAFSISIRGSVDTVVMDQKALTFIVTINNLGSSKIKKMNIHLDSLPPFSGCIKFEGGLDREVDNIAPFSTKEIVFSGGWVDLNCIKDNVIDNKLKPNTKTPVYVRATAWTYYPTASRLAVERIKSDFGLLLIRNNALRQTAKGATYKYGSAMTIDMDIGAQPILDDSGSAALLLRWQNVGNGQMKAKKDPILFIVTPKDFGSCIPAGYDKYDDPNSVDCSSDVGCVVCDDELVNSWCAEDGYMRLIIEDYFPDVISVLNWACDLAAEGKMHVCGTTYLTQEFNVFTCTLTIPEITTNEDVVTDYITTIAAYPYEVQSSTVTVNTFCTENQAGCGG
ncbi:MAG: hypothetical protein J7K73_00080 [Nanoarchaeota archaeon]|nr:hypothetical protein [Nanoarchaeota archaeon]